MTTVDTVRDPASLTSPFVGLTSYAQENAPFFFGRDAEQRVLISNLRASRLTLLYAQSGAGKSSVLRAGAAAKLAELARRSVEQRGFARYIPVVFSSWRDEPTGELIAEIEKAIAPFLPEPSPPGRTLERLDEVIEAASNAAGATLLVVLDQFEEYFLYRPREAHDGRFADELAACINRAGLHANFLISIREDAYSGLGDLFQGRIRNVYSNYLHLEHLTRESAREAIEKPITSFNELHPTEVPVEIESGLVDVILGQLGPDQFAPDQGGIGRLTGRNGSDLRGGEIAASYLQLVMKRLWETEVTRGSRTLHRATLEELGGAQTIVRTHVDRALDDLPEEAREAAVDIFHHLVTPSGTKIALAASDLAEYTGRPAAESSTLLERLASSDTRILRPVPPPPGQEGGTRYEISHDLLAPAILDWGGRQRAVRLEREKESAERVARVEKRRARMFRTLALGSGALLIIAIVALVVAVIAAHTAQRASQNAVQQHDTRPLPPARSAESEALDDTDPVTAALLAAAAWRIAPTAQARDSMLDVAGQPHHGALTVGSEPQAGPVGVTFSPDGKTLATVGPRGIRLWDLASHRQIGAPIHDAVNAVAFSPDSKILAAAEGGPTRLWNLMTRRPIGAPFGTNTGFKVTFSPDGKTLATTGFDGKARLWNVASHTQIGAPFGNKVNAVTFSPDGKTLATADGDGKARLWDLATHSQIGASFNIGPKAPGSAFQWQTVLFSPDGKTLATADQQGARLWDLATHTQIGAPFGDLANAVAFSPDGKTLATADGDRKARLWDLATHTQIGVPLGQFGITLSTTSAVAFSPDGKTLATGDDYGAHLWDLTAHDQIGGPLAFGTGGTIAMTFSPDGKTLATAGQDGKARLWDLATHTQIGAPLSITGGVYSATFSPDGKTLATVGNDHTARLWDLTTHTQIGSPFGNNVGTVAFSPDGKTLAAEEGSGILAARLWDLATRTKIGSPLSSGSADQPETIFTVAFSPDGKTLATVGLDGNVRLWDEHSRRQIGAPIRSGTPELSNDAVAFSPDGKTLATVDSRSAVRLWDLATHAQIGALAPPRNLLGGIQPWRQNPGHGWQRRHRPAVGPGHPCPDRDAPRRRQYEFGRLQP